MKRALLLSALMAPLLPGLAAAQVTPEHATALQDQLKGWLQSTLGVDAAAQRFVTITAAGDHYDIGYPLSTGPGAPVMTGKMTDAGNGRWAVDDVTLPSPSVFRYQVPAPKKPTAAAPAGGEATATITLGSQQQHMLIDPTLATPSTLSATLGDLGVTMQLPGVTQISHIDSGTSESTVTPVAGDRLDIASSTMFEGYTIKMSNPADQTPIAISASKASLVSTFKGVSRERGLALLRIATRANQAMRTAPAGDKAPPLDHATTVALLSALTELLTSASFDQRFNDITVTADNKTGSLKQLVLSLASEVDAGKLRARLPVVVEGLTLPDLGLGDLAQFVPTRLTLTPTVSSVPSDAVTQMIRKAADNQQPDPRDVNALFAQGPINAGIDDFHLDVAGSSLAGNVAMVVSSPAVFSGTGQVTAENLDSLQHAMSADPQAAQMAPLLIFLKGIARNEQNRLVWDINYHDGRLLVNGQDMAALTGSPPPDRKTPATRPTRPNSTRP